MHHAKAWCIFYGKKVTENLYESSGDPFRKSQKQSSMDTYPIKPKEQGTFPLEAAGCK